MAVAAHGPAPPIRARLDEVAGVDGDDLVLVGRQVEGGPPREVAARHVERRDGELEPLVFHGADVPQLIGEPARKRHVHDEQQILGLGPVRIRRDRQPVVQEGHVDAQVVLGRRLPLQVGVGGPAARRERDGVHAADGVLGHLQAGQGVVGLDRLVAGLAVADPELEVVEDALALHEALVDGAPRKSG